MVDSAAVAGWAPKAPNGSNKSSATIKDFLRLRMDFFPSGCGFLDSGSGSERRRTGGTGGRLAAHLFLALQRASSLAPPQQRLTLLSAVEDLDHSCGDVCSGSKAA